MSNFSTSSAYKGISEILEALLTLNLSVESKYLDGEEKSKSSELLRLEDNYITRLDAPIPWITLIRNEILNYIMKSDYYEGQEGNWISRETGGDAIAFLDATGDVLPSEPRIYGTSEGELVAEYVTPTIRMTSVHSGGEALLFGYQRNSDSAPVQITVKRGSNQLREEVRQFTRRLAGVPDGKALAADRR